MQTFPGSRLGGFISVGLDSSVYIGKGAKVTENLLIRAVEKTSVTIGEDCLIARDVTIRTNDGHPIYDTNTGNRINNSKSITIGEHVWIGDEVAILKGATIGSGSVIAMRSVVTGSIPGVCVAAGIPAKAIRSDVTWEHNTKEKTEKFYSPHEITSHNSELADDAFVSSSD